MHHTSGGDRKREHAAVEAVAHEISGGHVTVCVGQRPEPGKHHVKNGVEQDRIRDSEKAHRTLAKDERRYGNERVGRIEITAEQEPGDDGAEAATAKPPLV